MDEVLICPECLGVLTDPVKLNCKHTFCYSCAASIHRLTCLTYSHIPDSFICPFCGVITALKPPSKTAPNTPNFERNHYLDCALKLATAEQNFALRQANSHSQEDDSSVEESGFPGGTANVEHEMRKVLCALCDNASENECLNCNLPLCKRCSTLHRENERVKHHKLLSYDFMHQVKEPILLEHIKTLSEKKLGDKVVRTKCAAHSTEDYAFYSLNQRRFYCQICVEEDSGLKGEAMPIEKAIQKLKKEADYEQVEARIKMLSKIVEKINAELELTKSVGWRCTKK